MLLTGCTSDGLSGLPGGASLAREGSSPLTFTAAESGTIYLRDQPADRIVYQGPVEKGQQLEVDAKIDRITLDGRPVKSSALRPDATYQVFFKAREKREYHPMMNP